MLHRTTALQPVLGVTLDDYALVSRRMASRAYDPAAAHEVASELGIPLEVWRRARATWDHRLATDPDVAAAFARSYRAT